jgi:mono/diheme cytochrome c family protein
MLFLCAYCFIGCRGQMSEKPPVHLNPNMDQQKRYDPQELSRLFRDMRTMRPLVEGTVARPPHEIAKRDSMYLKDDEHLYLGTIKGKFAQALPSQFSLDVHPFKALIQRGQNQYQTSCVPCHGATGNGKGVVTLFSKTLQPRNFHDKPSRMMEVGRVYGAIANGMGTMVSFSSQVSVQDRWAIVAYIRALQLSSIPHQSHQ